MPLKYNQLFTSSCT